MIAGSKQGCFRKPGPWIHQKIGLQSGKRRLQSGGKSTYRRSQAATPESQPSQGKLPSGNGGSPFKQDRVAPALEWKRERRTRRMMATACKHPKVRIVSRHDDTEYVECLECGEVFDSEEFRDMEIEDTVGTEPMQEDL
jgi:hypothetical protein